ncbi:MAG: hypothetical protein ABH859_04520 [Pseudomonadota bacterium]
MKKINLSCIVFFSAIAAFCAQCAKPMINATIEPDIRYVSETVKTDKQEAYDAAKWSLVMNGYPLATKDEKQGLLETAWVPSKTDSHALVMFNRRDLGVNGAYYQMIVQVVSNNGETRLDVGTRIKSVASGVKSTGIEERRILRDVKEYLRKKEPTVSNVGLEE